MYSILLLGVVMMCDAFGLVTPPWVSPAATFGIVAFFFLRSVQEARKAAKAAELGRARESARRAGGSKGNSVRTSSKRDRLTRTARRVKEDR